jgi:atypical dual specificity phosphatase
VAEPLLVLRNFGVAFGRAPVLADIRLEVPARGMIVLVGPAGSGKSTLLRTLAGVNDAHPSFTRWGFAQLDGLPLFGGEAHTARARISLVTQHSRFFVSTVRENLVSALPDRSTLTRAEQTEVAHRLLVQNGLWALAEELQTEVLALPSVAQRALAIVRAVANNPLLLLVDEPTSGLDDADAVDVLALLRAQARARAVVFVTHNQRHARASGGTTVLLGGGRVLDSDATPQFFGEPKTDTARWFVATGGSRHPSPASAEGDLDDESEQPTPLPSGVTDALAKSSVHPLGFFWVEPNRLGGLPRPGILADLALDLAGLRGLGVTVLVTLEQTLTVDPGLLASIGIHSLHFPVPDMGAPEIGPAAELCAEVESRIARGEVVALHCRAGLGRTGTLLASQLIWGGETALRAIERLRQINPHCIQSDEQARFLRAFEKAVRPGGLSSSLPPITAQ